MTIRVVVWGASGHATVVADILRLRQFEIAGFIDDVNESRWGMPFENSLLLGGRDRLAGLLGAGVGRLVVAIGDCGVRLSLLRYALEQGFDSMALLHPRSVVAASATLGKGSVVTAGAVINPHCRIGEAVIVNTGAVVDHDCVVRDGAHIAPGVTLAGGVEVGEEAFVGVGSVVRDAIRIGDRCVVGAGSVVVRDVPDNALVYGVPARVVRILNAED